MKQYFMNIWVAVYTLLVGLRVTFIHLFKPSVTLKYPYEKDTLPERSRMKLEMNWADCIGCKACERACPVECIHIDTTKAAPEDDLTATKNGTARKLLVTSFVIDHSECMYCGLCVPPCPEDCITMTPNYEFGKYDRSLLIEQFAPFTDEDRAKREAEEETKKQAQLAAKAAAEQTKEKGVE